MKKLSQLILTIFVLGQSFVMADLIEANPAFGKSLANPNWESEQKSNRINDIKEIEKRVIIIASIIIVILSCCAFLYLRNKKNNSQNPLPPQQ